MWTFVKPSLCNDKVLEIKKVSYTQEYELDLVSSFLGH